MKLTSQQVYLPGFQFDIDSYPIAESNENIKNRHNEVVDTVNGLAAAATNAETTTARPYNTSLKERLDQMAQVGPTRQVVQSGDGVRQQTVANMTVLVLEGSATAGGIQVTWSEQTSPTFSAPTTARFDAVVINSDATISVVQGNDSADPTMPSISNTQRPLAIVSLISSTSSITNSLIRDCTRQGCLINDNWFWRINDAVGFLGDRENETEEGEIFIGKGEYIETVDLSGISNVTLRYEAGAKHLRPSDAGICLAATNSGGSESTGVKILNGSFYGNGKAGTTELLSLKFCDEFVMSGCYFDGNASSGATYKDFTIEDSDNFVLNDNVLANYAATSNFTTCTDYKEDGFSPEAVMFASSVTARTTMEKKGWTHYSAAENRFIRSTQNPGTTGGSDTNSHGHGEHNHQWYDAGSGSTTGINAGSVGGSTNQSWESTGSAKNFSTPGGILDADFYTVKNNLAAPSDTNNMPAYYEMVAMVHR